MPAPSRASAAGSGTLVLRFSTTVSPVWNVWVRKFIVIWPELSMSIIVLLNQLAVVVLSIVKLRNLLVWSAKLGPTWGSD